MTQSALTDRVWLTGDSSPRTSKIDTFLIHHAAMVSQTGESVARLYLTKNVSSNYVIGSDGTLWLTVDEDRRAHTSGSSTDGGKGAAWDQRSVTVEIANETGAPDWYISEAAITTAAKLLNDLRTRMPIPNVLGHRELWENWGASYPTYCPGPDTVNRIGARATELSKPTIQIGDPLVSAVFVKRSTKDSAGNRTTKTLMSLAGENPGTGEANWIEFYSPVIDGNDWRDLGAGIYRGFGSRSAIDVTDEQWDYFKAKYRSVNSVQIDASGIKVEVDLASVTTRLDEIQKVQKAKRTSTTEVVV